jgi:hypothetical protein
VAGVVLQHGEKGKWVCGGIGIENTKKKGTLSLAITLFGRSLKNGKRDVEWMKPERIG